MDPRRLRHLALAALVGLTTVVSSAAQPAAAAGLATSAGEKVGIVVRPPNEPDLPYGPDTCISGYVWREAIPGDNVCVTPATRSQTAYDNSQAAARRDPTGVYGSNTCISGFVWREAYDGDVTCVTPATRAQARYDNSQAAYRRAG